MVRIALRYSDCPRIQSVISEIQNSKDSSSLEKSLCRTLGMPSSDTDICIVTRQSSAYLELLKLWCSRTRSLLNWPLCAKYGGIRGTPLTRNDDYFKMHLEKLAAAHPFSTFPSCYASARCFQATTSRTCKPRKRPIRRACRLRNLDESNIPSINYH